MVEKKDKYVADTAVIEKSVIFLGSARVEHFCILGVQADDCNCDPVGTTIGKMAIIRSHAVIYDGSDFGSNLQVGHKANIRELCKIGKNVSIGTLAVLEHKVVIEDDVRIHSQAFIPEYSIIKRGAWIGPNVVLTNSKYPKSPRSKQLLEGVIVQEGAKIGANVTVLPGVVIGRFSVIGAGSVVTKNVPDGAVMVGNPAKQINVINNLPYVESLKS